MFEIVDTVLVVPSIPATALATSGQTGVHAGE